MSGLRTLLKKYFNRRVATRLRSPNLFIPRFEPLETRRMLAVTATFSPISGVLSVFGDSQDNAIQISRNVAGEIFVNGGAVSIGGGAPTTASTTLIQVFGMSGNDTISLNETNGPMPAANLYGGAGDDTLSGGSAADRLFGQAGMDTLFGMTGFDLLFGGAANDDLTGGDGEDQVFGQSDSDQLIWNPGDDTDLNEGGSGVDAAIVNGGNGAEDFTVTSNGARVRFDRINPAPFALDIGTTENLLVNAGGGNDTFAATGNLAALILITVDGGAGDDTLRGSNGPDLFLAGDDNDFVDGNQGDDTVVLGTGNDTAQWDPGDGSDTIEGNAGSDTLIFNGSNGNEIFDISANLDRVRLTRNLGNIVMDINDLERIDVNALGGADTATVNNLSGTDTNQVNLNLSGVLGGISGDAQPDNVIVNGTSGNDNVAILGAGTNFSVAGMSTLVAVANSEIANDRLVVNALGGLDSVSAATLPAGVVQLTLDGGIGNDTLQGSPGADVLLGGNDQDLIEGNLGNDTALMGAGNDFFRWDPGDGNDTVEGQADHDTLVFVGSASNENVDIAANGARVSFFRNVGNVIMDLDDVEQIDFHALGGADAIVMGDLTGTDATLINLALANTLGGGAGDVQPDLITLIGSNNIDNILVTGSGTSVTVTGLKAVVNITQAEAAYDQLTVNAQGGADTVNASGLPANVIGLTINAGLGEDVILGSQGNDLVNGGDGNDTALLGAGNDTFVWNPGDDNDTIEGQADADTMLFNGANAAENIDIAANGGRVIFFRNVASVIMDLNDVEQIDFNALGGADTIVINDLSGTDVTEINLNLAVFGGGGDAQPDSVVINGTNDDDGIVVDGDATGVVVLGLAAIVNITAAEAANDRLTINSLAGEDVVDASGLAATGIALTVDGGADDDSITGGDGADTLLGGEGDDVLIGGPGVDILDGGPGNNILIQ